LILLLADPDFHIAAFELYPANKADVKNPV
jgi:hypothetical protein